MIVHWPNGIQAHGDFRHTSAHLTDLAPTIMDLVGGAWPTKVAGAPAPPGKSLTHALARDQMIPHDYFWWYHDGNRALRAGDWKIVADHKKPWELYDLKADRSETKDLADANKERVRVMAELWNQCAHQFRDDALKR